MQYFAINWLWSKEMIAMSLMNQLLQIHLAVLLTYNDVSYSKYNSLIKYQFQIGEKPVHVISCNTSTVHCEFLLFYFCLLLK